MSLALGVLRAADPLAILIAGFLAHLIRIGSFAPSESYIIVIVLGAVLAANFLSLGGSYRVDSDSLKHPQFLRSILIWFAVIGMLLTGLFLAKVSVTYSRGFIVYWVVLATGLLLLNRVMLSAIVSTIEERGGLRNRVAVLGNGKRTRSVIERLFRSNTDQTYVIGGFVPNDEEMEYIQGKPVFGKLDSLVQLIERGQVDEVVMCFEHKDRSMFRDALALLSDSPINIVCTTGADVDDLPIIGTKELGGVFVLRLADRPLSGWYGVAKEIEDKILATLMLILLSPVMLAIAAAIRLTSPGPVLFRQLRYGFNNNQFEVFKFRTMRQHEEDETFLRQATQDDPRVTGLGRFLRRTSLDELPQLLNVLQGTMSLVGPRPHAVSHNAYYGSTINGYLSRHRVKRGSPDGPR